MTVVRFRYPAAIPVCILFLVLAVPAWAATVYVDASATGAGDGTTPADAYTAIQDAIDNAGAGDTIEIAAGTYAENLVYHTLNAADLTFQGAGMDQTIIDGSGSGRVMDVNSDSSCTILDLTIRNGSLGATSQGAGLRFAEHTNAPDLTLENVKIAGNTLTAGDPVYGAGMSFNSSGDLAMTGCIVTGNQVTGAGNEVNGIGAYVHAISPDTVVTLTGCEFSNNATAAGLGQNTNGGGLRVSGSADASFTATDCIFKENSLDLNAEGSGAGIYVSDCQTTLEDCEISGNTLTSDDNNGCGVYIGAGTYTLTRCAIRGNSAAAESTGGVARGAGVYVYEGITNPGPQKIVDCEISGNTASSWSGVKGVGIYIDDTGSGIDTMLVNTTISGNTLDSGDWTSRGGGLAVAGGEDHTVSLDSCTISGNRIDYRGGGIAMLSGAGNPTLQVTNTIVHGNSADWNPDTGPDMYDDNGANADIVSGGANIVGDSGGFVWHTSSPTDQIGQDPGLAALADNGGPTKTHAISADSPACDAGATEQTEDQRGETRPSGEADDIGAFEFQQDPPVVDGGDDSGGGGGGDDSSDGGGGSSSSGCTPGAGSTLWLALLAPGALWLAARRG